MTELLGFVEDFAAALKAVDAARPQARPFRPGIGPHREDIAVDLILRQIERSAADRYILRSQVPYPDSRLRCDIGIGQPLEWAVEVKMARAMRDNGDIEPAYIKDVISPYPDDRSALTDAQKLQSSGFACRKAVLVYGFDYPNRPLEPLIDALTVLLERAVRLGSGHVSEFADLTHPVHQRGFVFAWEIGSA